VDQVKSLAALAEHLLSGASVQVALGGLDRGDVQLLTAVAALAERLHGPLPPAAPGTAAILMGPGGREVFDGVSPRWNLAGLDPAERVVPRAELLRHLDLAAEGRAAAEAGLDRLAARALLLPAPDGQLVVPVLVHRAARELSGYGRPADQLLNQAYNAQEVHRIAQELGFPKARTRDEAQRQILTALGDPARVRALAAQAPPEARELLDRLVPGPPLLRTHCFDSRQDYGYYADSGSTFTFRSGSSGEPGAEWLAARGLLLPVGPATAELPYEVGHALRDGAQAPRYEPAPPGIPAAEVSPGAVVREAQAALGEAAARVELILQGVAAQPLSVRKSGGVAVRDTKRLAKQAGAPEDRTRFWLDLAANADLLVPYAPEAPAPPRGRARRPEPRPPAQLIPTERYDRWLAAAPAQRMLPLLAAWVVVPEVLTHWPDEDDTPVALVSPQDPEAVELRQAVLSALATLPPGRGAPAAALLPAAAWFRPFVVGQGRWDGERVAATLAEAELLGVVAHGALTPAGQAVLGLLEAGAHRYFPAVPGAGPSLRDHPALDAAVRRLAAALAGALPAPRTTARFQADLTAVVAGAAAPELAELLAACAERESVGQAVVWRITPASVRRALDSGLGAPELLARLAEASEGGAPLPQPLEYLVNDTSRTHGRVRVVRSACCLRADDEALVLELSKARALAGLGLRRIAPTVLISTAEPEATLAALRTAGYAPVLEAETGTTVVERAPRQRGPNHMPPLSRGGTTAKALVTALLGAGSVRQ
jgi:hypothetical protein